jgi:hypothetical protein
MSGTSTVLSWIVQENVRLRAALEKILNDPGGHPAEGVVDDMREIAREALAQPTGGTE